jgi:Xaa-Pro aminopeptidase
MNSPLTQLRHILADKSLDGILLTDLTNIGWVSNFSGSFARILVTTEEAIFITDSRYQIQAAEEVQGFTIVTYATPKTLEEVFAEELQRLGVGKLGFESASTTVGTYSAWQEKHPSLEWHPLAESINELRMIKSPAEVAKIREACRLADACFDNVLGILQPGVRELDVAMAIDFYFRKQGAESAFHTIAVSGLRSARPHGVPSTKELALGDFLTMDFGAKLDGYNSDITRTVVIGKATDRHREIYDQVLKAQLASLDAIKPGVIAGDVDQIARTVLNEKEFAKYFGHGLGHGLGRLVHDPGRLGAGSKTVITPGQVWTVEPGVYIEDFGGVRIEDDVVVTEMGIEILTHSTKELLELPFA